MPQRENHKEIASRLCRRGIDGLSPAAGGANNRIYRVTAASQSYALKFYPPQEGDKRDRLGTEFSGLTFLSENGIYDVPSPIARDHSNHCALYSWVEGDSLAKPTAEGVSALANFFLKIQELRGRPGAQELEFASAACPSPTIAKQQLLDRLNALKQKAVPSPELSSFLEKNFAPVVRRVLNASSFNTKAEILGFDRLALSPSDFGLHNSLRQNNGRYVFLDFEYFGWDDPVKAIADVMLHPGHSLDNSLRNLFYEKVASFFMKHDAAFETRFQTLYPLYGLIWCLIILNDFMPERWERRRIAGEEQPWEDIRMKQLAKADALLNTLKNGGGTHAHF